MSSLCYGIHVYYKKLLVSWTDRILAWLDLSLELFIQQGIITCNKCPYIVLLMIMPCTHVIPLDKDVWPCKSKLMLAEKIIQ